MSKWHSNFYFDDPDKKMCIVSSLISVYLHNRLTPSVISFLFIWFARLLWWLLLFSNLIWWIILRRKSSIELFSSTCKIYSSFLVAISTHWYWYSIHHWSGNFWFSFAIFVLLFWKIGHRLLWKYIECILRSELVWFSHWITEMFHRHDWHWSTTTSLSWI